MRSDWRQPLEKWPTTASCCGWSKWLQGRPCPFGDFQTIRSFPCLSPFPSHSLWAWCVYHISNLMQEDGPRLMRAPDGSFPQLKSGYCLQLTAEVAVNGVLPSPSSCLGLRARNPLTSSGGRRWNEKQQRALKTGHKISSAFTVLPHSSLTTSTLGQLEDMKRPQDALWNMFCINPQLVAVTAKLENTEAKLPSFFFFPQVKTLQIQGCEHLG